MSRCPLCRSDKVQEYGIYSVCTADGCAYQAHTKVHKKFEHIIAQRNSLQIENTELASEVERLKYESVLNCQQCGVKDSANNAMKEVERLNAELHEAKKSIVAGAGYISELQCKASEVERPKRELDAAYAEMSKQEPALTAVYDRDVWERMRKWRKEGGA